MNSTNYRYSNVYKYRYALIREDRAESRVSDDVALFKLISDFSRPCPALATKVRTC